ncbi:MAG: hypothetical protein M3297_15660 [Thermoproteota archaeon]|nr:hypothetical protein [Thermoproteota archaeon]
MFQSEKGYGTILSSVELPPLPVVLATITITTGLSWNMSTKLLTRKADSTEQKEEEEDNGMTTKEIEREIECPRCFDIMTLSSDFDSLGYICQKCDLLLVMK